ncbi:MAG: TIGR03915 family putative DNA repair protein [Cytophagaceae bacterium]|jgi:probable DNA metabolism protein|nr:TIGR03915 family putative DNA repair protein [Cytophagaceae bacterium]
MNSIEYRYDGTFQGFLCAVFDIYSRRDDPVAIHPTEVPSLLFTDKYTVITNAERAERVWDGIVRTGGEKTGEHIYHAFLSCEKNVEILLMRYLRHLFLCKRPVMDDLAYPDVLKVFQLYRTVSREAHRILMFLRFEQSADGVYFAPFAPKYDVLPLTLNHFKSRFASQSWIIYDTARNYGFYYDLQTVERITINEPAFNRETGKLARNAEHPDENQWQALWQIYFKKTAIAERKNLLLQQNFMPKRFWKYLTEKRAIV